MPLMYRKWKGYNVTITPYLWDQMYLRLSSFAHLSLSFFLGFCTRVSRTVKWYVFLKKFVYRSSSSHLYKVDF